MAPGARSTTTWLNGAPAIRLDRDGETVVAVSLVIVGDRITHLYAVSNPHKLARLDHPVPVSR